MKDLAEVAALFLLIMITIALWFVFHGEPSVMDVWHAQIVKQGCAK